MFGMGWAEIFLIAVVGLLVIGPEKLPEVARGLARGIRQVQRLAAELRESVNLEEHSVHRPQGSPVIPQADDDDHLESLQPPPPTDPRPLEGPPKPGEKS